MWKNISGNKLLIIPLLCLGLAIGFLAIFFNYFFKAEQEFLPIKNLEITEPFSGNLYFNDQLGGHIFSDKIIPAIDGAQTNIELAVYSIDNTQIRDALYRAANRGVEVLIIVSDKRQTGHDLLFQNQPKNFKRITIASDEGSMHHKFMIIDNRVLFFGSYNFTYLQEKYDPCFLLETNRQEIIEVFGAEVERLKIGATSTNSFAAKIKYPEGFLEIWFSPQRDYNNLRQRMLELISGARQNITGMIWNFTDNTLASGLVLAAQRIPVNLITDDVNFNGEFSAFKVLAAEKAMQRLDNLEIITDANRNQELITDFKVYDLNSFLHHHLLLIDNQVAVFGTNNWTKNGFYENSESIMITDIPAIVLGFKTSFDFNYERNK